MNCSSIPLTRFFLPLLALLGSVSMVFGQTQPINLSNTPGRTAHGFTEANEELPSRNHGTGIRLGAAWSNVRSGRPMAAFEGGAFHQHALNRGLSVQIEALYYRQQVQGHTMSGLRLPALIVLNPFYNVSLHAGPQLQYPLATSAAERLTTPDQTAAVASRRLSVALVTGTEARVEFLRVGIRFALPFESLSNLPMAGEQISTAWKTGQVQAYLGASF